VRDLSELNGYRLRDIERRQYGCEGDENCGVFGVKDRTLKNVLRVLASSGEGWDHVSVSLPHRCPSWAEMEFVKRLFFRPEETVMQLHVPPSDHISVHPYCLHLWRPQAGEIPRPPAWMVA
jgi:hypothetical protein